MEGQKEPEVIETKLEKIYKILIEIKDEQKHIEEEISNNKKILMKKISKLEEYNSIDDMSNHILNEQIVEIKNKVIDIEKTLY